MEYVQPQPRTTTGKANATVVSAGARFAYYGQIVARYFIATILLIYAAAKIFETQFYVEPSVADIPVRFLTGFEFAWIFYGYSYIYGALLAAAQVAVSLFLFFPRTVRIGLLIFFPLMGNILLLDIFYGVYEALPMVYALLLAGTYLLLYDFRTFFKFLLVMPFVRGTHLPMARRIGWIKFVYIPLAFLGTFGLIYSLSQQYMFQTPLTGIWKPETRLQFQGTEPLDRLYVDLGTTCLFRSVGAERPSYPTTCTVDSQRQTITMQTPTENQANYTIAFNGTYNLSPDGNHLTLTSTGPAAPQTYEFERLSSNHKISDRLGIGGHPIPER